MKIEEEIFKKEIKEFIEIQKLLLKGELNERKFKPFPNLTEDENGELLRWVGYNF